MQHLYVNSRRHSRISARFSLCQDQVRFFALHRIKPHAPPLVRAPSIHLSFNLAAVLPRRSTYCVNCVTKCSRHPTTGRHRLRRGLPGYLILFAPHAFEPQCQYDARGCLRHRYSSRYLRISPLHLEFYPLSPTLAYQYQMQFPS